VLLRECKMRNGKKGNGLILVTLLGLLAVIGIGAWLLMGDSDAKPASKPVKPTAELSR
jgi:hypothetical protein